MADAPASTQLLRSFDQLRAPFEEAIKPVAEHRIGAEAEKFGVDAVTGAPLPYEGERGVLSILQALAERYGWAPEGEFPGGPIIALTRGRASITLEPGGQLELSGAPLETLHEIEDELDEHLEELRSITDPMGIAWLGVGFHPFARQAELPWVPKSRYGIMKRFLPTRGEHGLDMMRRTATVQANFDYESEEAAMRKLRVGLKLAPVGTALFANSPFYEGEAYGGRSYRAQTWLSVEPSRQGLVPRVLEGARTFDAYIDWALDAPMFLVKRGTQVMEATHLSFRDFLRDGLGEEKATMGDWVTHLNSMFPEVRLKRTLEVRGADSLPADLATSLPALWTGIYGDARALDEAEALCEGFTLQELEALRPLIAQHGLRAPFRGRPVIEVAEKLVDISARGLVRRARLDPQGRDERSHLAPIARLVAKGQCPADALLEGLPSSGDARRRAILERAQV